MPTSAEEALNIVAIINEYLPVDKAIEITKRLDQEIGTKTENMSLKVSLQMLRKIYEPVVPTFFHNNAPFPLKVALYSIVSFHMALLAGNIVSMMILPFLMPWYVSLPLISLLVNFMFSAVSCPLTRLESVVRRNMGLPEIRFFIQHYFYKPSWKKRRN